MTTRNTEVITINNPVTVIECDMCEKYVKTSIQGHDSPFADNGSEVTIVGGYGQFIDCEIVELTLCHDCTLEIFRKVPKLRDAKALHSVSIHSENYPLCCEYSWTTNEQREIVYGDERDFKPQKTYNIKRNRNV